MPIWTPAKNFPAPDSEDDDRSSVSSEESTEEDAPQTKTEKVWDLLDTEKLPPTTDPKLAEAIRTVFGNLGEWNNDPIQIICRMNHTCCNTCGYYEMEQDLLSEEVGYTEETLNYIFFHIQETERLADGATRCYINHRFNEEGKKYVLEYIAKKEHGGQYLHWDGDEGKKMIISPYPLTEDD
jgi:hypothetical protein